MARRRSSPASKQPAQPATKKHKIRSTVPQRQKPQPTTTTTTTTTTTVPATAVVTMTLYFHPQRGGSISSKPISPGQLTYRARPVDEWREIMKVQMMRNERGLERPVPGQKLPKGFLWGDPTRQKYSVGGPELVFGPLPKVCYVCKEPFIFPAHAQKHLYEVIGRYIDTTATRCMTCARRSVRLERARVVHAKALGELKAHPVAASYLAVAQAALELLEAGGQTRLDRAVGQARRARLLGARAAEKVEERLKALWAEAQAAKAVKK